MATRVTDESPKRAKAGMALKKAKDSEPDKSEDPTEDDESEADSMDSEYVKQCRLKAIFKRARAIGMEKYILKNDDGDSDDDSDDDAGGGGGGEAGAPAADSDVPEEVREVAEVMAKHVDLVFMIFDYYCIL